MGARVQVRKLCRPPRFFPLFFFLNFGWLLGTGHPESLAVPSPELRGVWVDAFHSGYKNEAQVAKLFHDLRLARINTVFVQVRKRGDAYYRSDFVPKATDIAPDFDPLDSILRHANSSTNHPPIEVHAWFVMYPIWNRQSAPPKAANHLFNAKPDWLGVNAQGATWDGANHNLDPGHPAVQEHLTRVVTEVIARYPVDGIHFDYIRYPGNQWGYNRSSLERFNRRFRRAGKPSPSSSAWLQFRRDQVTSLVRRLYLTSQTHDPKLKVSAALICFAPGILRSQEWSSSAAYSSVLQDWRLWMEQGILDLAIPMAYFNQRSHAQDWGRWNQFIKEHQYQRQAAIGMGWFLNESSASIEQLSTTRKASRAGNFTQGFVGFSYANHAANRDDWPSFADRLARNPENPDARLTTPVTIPSMPWKDSPLKGHFLGRAHWNRSPPPFEPVIIKLENSSHEVRMECDANGYFGTTDLPPGLYRLSIETPFQFGPIEGQEIQIGEVTEIDLDLATTLAPTLSVETMTVDHMEVVITPWFLNLSYILQTKKNLDEAEWTMAPLENERPNNDSSTASFQVETGPDQRFFRVLVKPLIADE